MIAAFALLLMPSPAHAADLPVTIINQSKVDPDPASIFVGDTITWTNEDSLPRNIYLAGDSQPLNKSPILPKGGTFTTSINVVGTLRYGLEPSDNNPPFTIKSTPKPTTTTAPTTTTTTTAPTTTTASTTTTSQASIASTSSTSTASSSTTSSTIAAAAPPPSGGGGSSAAPLLAAAAVVVAALAGVTFWAWRRSGEMPYAPGAGAGTGGAPPTAGQSPV